MGYISPGENATRLIRFPFNTAINFAVFYTQITLAHTIYLLQLKLNIYFYLNFCTCSF